MASRLVGILAAIGLVTVLVLGGLQSAHAYRLSDGPAQTILVNERPTQFDLTTVKATPIRKWQQAWLRLSGKASQIAPASVTTPAPSDSTDTSIQNAKAAASKITNTSVGTPDLGGVIGPSAGLMTTLALAEQASSSDLTPGTAVYAGTGTVDASGIVGAVGGVEYKVAGAIRLHAKVFFVPAQEGAEARTAAHGKITVVEVTDVSQAISWLCSEGGTGALCPTSA